MRIVASIWIVGVATFAGLDLIGVLSVSPGLEKTAWVVNLVIIAVDSLGGLAANRVRKHRRERLAGIEKALMGLLIQLDRNERLRFAELGASVYVPSRWSNFFQRPQSKVRLKRIVRFRPAGYPQQSAIAWVGAKGLVGAAWCTRHAQYADFSALARRWGGKDISPERFSKIPEETRAGFTLEEFRRVVGKYSEIAAEPLWHEGKERKLIGVLSVDRAFDAKDENYVAQLGVIETQSIIAATASTISGILKPKMDPA